MLSRSSGAWRCRTCSSRCNLASFVAPRDAAGEQKYADGLYVALVFHSSYVHRETLGALYSEFVFHYREEHEEAHITFKFTFFLH